MNKSFYMDNNDAKDAMKPRTAGTWNMESSKSDRSGE